MERGVVLHVWLLKVTEDEEFQVDYEEAYGYLVVARSRNMARQMAAEKASRGGLSDSWKVDIRNRWISPTRSTCLKLGLKPTTLPQKEQFLLEEARTG